MKTAGKFLTVVFVSVCIVVAYNLFTGNTSIDGIATVRSITDGAVVTKYQDDAYIVQIVDEQGTIKKEMSIDTIEGNKRISVADIAVSDKGDVFMIKDYHDMESGRYTNQQLVQYDIGRVFIRQIKSHDLSNEKYRYRFLALGSSLTLMGVDESETEMVRESYEVATIAGNSLQSRSVRTYKLAADEGISAVAVAGSDVAYMTRSGKIFLAKEGSSSVEKYPARALERLMYPTFISAKNTDSIYLGEQESGDFLTLNLSTGETSVIKNGTEPFSGVTSASPKDILQMDYISDQQFVGVVKNNVGEYDILLTVDGELHAISHIKPSIFKRFASYLLQFVIAFALLWLCIGVVYFVYSYIKNGKTILVKLMIASVPLLIASMVIFGVFSYGVYQRSVTQSFQKQVIDEGNLLMALFGTDSFSEIEFPYDYTSEAYGYLINQMLTREIFTRTAYFEQGELYIGVDRDMPCFYPLDSMLNSSAYDIYKQAAFSGKVKTGVIEDMNGKRIVAVTPIGGVSGDTVYLLETGILQANMQRYTTPFALSYIAISVFFIIGITTILTFVFLRVLKPLKGIRVGMEDFATGNRAVRLENTTKDELSDIIRVFNKLSNDIDTQIFNLKQVGETYYRFIPQNSYTLLGKNSIAELKLGSYIQKQYQLAAFSLAINSEHFSLLQEQDLINRFFNIVNAAAVKYAGILIADSANLCRFNIVCPDNHAVDIALSVLTEADRLNAALPVQIQLDILAVVHKAELYYGVLGDKARYIPALICNEMKQLTAKEDVLKQFTCRLIVTGAAMEDIGADKYSNRFIGFLDETRAEKVKLYDMYDCFSQEQIRLIEDTKQTFDKAMTLYFEGRYYDAKNLLALVIRDNQYDNVARHYIFECERHLKDIITE